MAPRWTRWIVTVVLLVPGAVRSFAEPASARIAPDAVIETIVFEGIAMPERVEILERIAVKVGDRLDADARQRIGQRLNPPADARLFSYRDRGLTFTDRPGSRSGRVVLVISLGC